MSAIQVSMFSYTKIAALRVLESLIMICSILLLLSWPLKHTIALRNISLVLGFCSSFLWLLLARPVLSLKNLAPPLLLLCVPLWLVIEYLFFPLAPSIQFAELTSLWVRVVLAVPFAFVCGILINRCRVFLRLFIAVSCVYPAIPVLMSLYGQLLGGAWLPGPEYIFKTKVSGVYWLMWSCSLGFALMHRALLQSEYSQIHQRKNWPLILVSAYLICFSLFDFFLLNALNGILIGLAVGSVLLSVYMQRFFTKTHLRRRPLYLLSLAIVLSGLLGVGAIYKGHSADYSNKLAPLYWDIKASLDIDKTKTWQRSDQVRGLPDPKNDLGNFVNVSAYERASWLIKGFSLLLQNPLGTGYTSQAFHYFMSKEYPGSTVQKTHCGWLDMALGLGIPGIMFLCLAIGSILFLAYQALKADQCGINIGILWMLGTMFLLWWPAELGEREYIESLFYVAALFAGALIKLPKE